MVRPLIDAFYNDVRRAPDEGKLVAWCIEQAPFELLRAMDISFVHLGNYAVRTSTRHAENQFKAASEAQGFLPEICTYARITAGLALLDKSGSEIENPEFLIPRPDLIIGTASVCQNMGNWYEAISKLYDVPVFCLDIPIPYDKSNLNRDIDFMKSQINDLIGFLEMVSGHSLDWDRWREKMSLIRKASELRHQISIMGKNIPAPISYFDLLSSMGVFNILRGTQESVDYFTQLKDEVEDRVARGIGCIPDEKYRLAWDGLCMWYKIGDFSEKLASHRAVAVAGPYTHHALYYEVDWIDPEYPLDTLAAAFYVKPQHTRHLLDDRINHMLRMIENYHLNGLIVHSSRTCRPWSIGEHDIIDAVKQTLGIPCLMIDADHADPAYYNDYQVDSDLESFLEILEASIGEKSH
ncbi:2-hydroxyacyl-CoA dehydratase subunit D [Chloroflexota bacterium]